MCIAVIRYHVILKWSDGDMSDMQWQQKQTLVTATVPAHRAWAGIMLSLACLHVHHSHFIGLTNTSVHPAIAIDLQCGNTLHLLCCGTVIISSISSLCRSSTYDMIHQFHIQLITVISECFLFSLFTGYVSPPCDIQLTQLMYVFLS